MDIDKRLVDIARRDLLKMAAMTGTVGILTALGEALSPALAAVVGLQARGKGGAKAAPEPKLDPNANDLGIVNVAIQLEQRAINTYLGMEKEKLIVTKDVVEVARQFAADHMAHRDALLKAATDEFKGTPSSIKGLGTFPVPATAMKQGEGRSAEVNAVRYGLALELIASKIYYEAFKDKLRTKAGRELIITILPVETQHVGIFRSLLKFGLFKLKDNQLPDNNRVVPFALLDKQPTPESPKGFSWDFEKLT